MTDRNFQRRKQMKASLSAVFATVLAVSANAFGVYDPTWDRPLFTAFDMDIISTQHGFNDVEKVDVTLTKKDGQRKPSGITIAMEIRHSNTPEVKKLVITDITQDGCGSTVYHARLPQKKNGRVKGAIGARFNLTLTDHTTRLCHDMKANIWEASIREGYGWCGTMDATMELEGNPEAVITIQSVR
jgi:hypothetical protein